MVLCFPWWFNLLRSIQLWKEGSVIKWLLLIFRAVDRGCHIHFWLLSLLVPTNNISKTALLKCHDTYTLFGTCCMLQRSLCVIIPSTTGPLLIHSICTLSHFNFAEFCCPSVRLEETGLTVSMEEGIRFWKEKRTQRQGLPSRYHRGLWDLPVPRCVQCNVLYDASLVHKCSIQKKLTNSNLVKGAVSWF